MSVIMCFLILIKRNYKWKKTSDICTAKCRFIVSVGGPSCSSNTEEKNVCLHLLSHSHNIFKEEVKFWAMQHPEKIEQNHGCDHVESYSVEKNSEMNLTPQGRKQ
jgi:hypothetical protein